MQLLKFTFLSLLITLALAGDGNNNGNPPTVACFNNGNCFSATSTRCDISSSQLNPNMSVQWQNVWEDFEKEGKKPTWNEDPIEKNYKFIIGSVPNFDLRDKRVLVPLCGDSFSIIYFASKGCTVVGCELTEIAIEKLIERINKSYPQSFTTEIKKGGKIYRSNDNKIIIVQGDIFDSDIPFAGTFDLVYDRAALVALDPSMRVNYCKRISSLISENTLLFFDVVERGDGGPPYTITQNDLLQLYPEKFKRIIDKQYGGPRLFLGPKEIGPPTGNIYLYLLQF